MRVMANDSNRTSDSVPPFDAADAAEKVTGLATEETEGAVVGRYTLVRVIGTGSFGTVWEARQSDPVERSVAVKIIKSEKCSEETVARFEVEGRALALMDHPNIPTVLGVGVTPSGRPFIAMELVKGTSLMKYCDENTLPVAERLKLLRDVCLAVHHAHMKGVIHRDLKPENVLISDQDGRAMPRVIDFGIAKALHRPLTDTPLVTQFHQVMGTLAYMSPEQAEMTSMDVDTRSDVYSLGVILYELLSGVCPFPEDELRDSPLPDACRTIREKDPPRLSTGLDQLPAEDSADLARTRRTTSSALRKVLCGDVHRIVTKCLEKDRNRRYQSAAELANDIDAWLDHRPVSAGAAGSLYRLRKHVRRHWVGFSAAAAVVLCLAAGLVVSTFFYLRSEEQRKTADDNRDRAEVLVENMLGNLTRLTKSDPQEALNEVGRLVEDYYAGIPEDELTAGQWKRKGWAIAHVGDYHRTAGEFEKAVAPYEEALAIFEKLIDDGESNRFVHSDLAVCLNYLGTVHRNLGNTDLARRMFSDGHLLLSQLLKEYPDDTDFVKELAVSHNALGDRDFANADLEAARGHFQKALEVRKRLVDAAPNDRDRRSDLASSHLLLASVARASKNPGQAVAECTESVSILRKLTTREPKNMQLQAQLGAALHQLGALQKRSAPEVARRHFEEAVEARRILVDSDPFNAVRGFDLAVSLNFLGDVLRRQGEKQGSLNTFRAAEAFLELSVQRQPENAKWRRSLGQTQFRMALAYHDLDHPDRALESCSAAVAVYEALLDQGELNSSGSEELKQMRKAAQRFKQDSEKTDHPS